MYRVQRYSSEYFDLWNNFVTNSKNGTFLFHRNFMEYHADRFEDHSLLVFEGNKLRCIVPAHKEGTVLASHKGLTYGGLVLDFKAGAESVIHILTALLGYCAENGFTKFYIKSIPSFYHKVPSQEVDYALINAGAVITARYSWSVYSHNAAVLRNKERKRSVKKGVENNLSISEGNDFASFWNEILVPNLQIKHNVKPVHSVAEMEQLNAAFPELIRQFNVYHANKIVAGVTVFIKNDVIHAQYISGNADKNKLGSVDYLFDFLINTRFKDVMFFDFGSSNQEQGSKLNAGLTHWKESYGARTVIQDFYEIDVNAIDRLQHIIL